MITWLRSSRMHDGILEDALSWAVEVAEYVKENLEGPSVEVRRNVGGPLLQVHWVSQYDSLAQFEEVMARVEEDEGYQELLDEAREANLFIGTSVSDYLYRTVS